MCVFDGWICDKINDVNDCGNEIIIIKTRYDSNIFLSFVLNESIDIWVIHSKGFIIGWYLFVHFLGIPFMESNLI